MNNLFNSNRELSRAITYSSFSVSVARCISNKISRVAFFFCLNLLLRLRVRMKTNETFPFARIPAFEAYAFDARQKGKFDEIIYSPVVIRDDLKKWLNFSNTNRHWIIESTVISENLTKETSTTEIESSFFNISEDSSSIPNTTYFIFNENSTNLTPLVYNESDTNVQHGILYPIFQTSPPPRKTSSASTTNLAVIDLSSNRVYHSVSAAAIELKGKNDLSLYLTLSFS